MSTQQHQLKKLTATTVSSMLSAADIFMKHLD